MSVRPQETDPRNPITMEAVAWPTTLSPEDRTTRTAPDADPASLVRRLVRASVDIVKVRDERLQACFDVMSTQAIAFADEMLSLTVKPELFSDQSTVIPRRRLGWNSYSPYSIDTMPMYALRHKSRYGGGELTTAYGAEKARLFVTAKEDFLGHFALVSFNRRIGYEYDRRTIVEPADIINPEHFTSAESIESILQEFAVDLGASAVAARKGLTSYKRWKSA